MPKQILIVDDNPDDSQLLERFLRKKGVSNPIRTVVNGLAAIDYLSGLDPFNDRSLYPLPALIFLDVNMPGRTGYDVLEWLNSHSTMPPSTVVIWTDAIDFKELEKCYLLGANSLLLKQTMNEQFRDLLRRYPDVWEFADPATFVKLTP